VTAGNVTDDPLKYDRLVEDALRGVVRCALECVAEKGLPGDHHFYITFRTDYPGVVLPAHLRQRFQKEMTIVLQYQYANLEVRETSFSVVLYFSEIPAQLVVPFDAVISFADPSVRFALQFERRDEAAEEAAEEAVQELPSAETSEPPPATPEPASEGEDKVVTLDKFRKR
jgi:hypothetical protein